MRWAIILFVALILAVIAFQNTDVFLSPFNPVIETCVEEIPGSEWIEPYKEYLKENENAPRKGRGDDGLWRPIDSPEGGQEICYGHKLQPGEPPIILEDGTRLNPPLTDEQCDQLLEDDIRKHIGRVLDEDSCVSVWLSRYRPDNACLNAEEIMMFTDYSYTGVLCQFVKFGRGIIDEDWDLVCREYKRYYTTPDGQRRPLRERNANFCCNFLEEHGCNCEVSCADRQYEFP